MGRLIVPAACDNDADHDVGLSAMSFENKEVSKLGRVSVSLCVTWRGVYQSECHIRLIRSCRDPGDGCSATLKTLWRGEPTDICSLSGMDGRCME